jgi:chemotaxis regulatin CheY-phosphate phosphatase CheZ
MTSKQLSGAEFRKQQQKEEEAFKLSQQWQKWLTDTKIDSEKRELLQFR